MENLDKAKEDVGNLMEEHPQQANEAEGKAKDFLGQHVSQDMADEAVDKGSEFLDNSSNNPKP